MKIAMIMPGRLEIESAIGKSKAWLPPSILAVAGATPEEHEISVIDELAGQKITPENLPQADLYAIGGLSTSRKRAYQLADLIRENKGIVVAGGMDVTGQFYENKQEELLKHYNSVVVARLTKRLWKNVLDDFEKKNLQKIYQASADEQFEFFIPRYDLINPKNYYFPAAVQTSAGCNETCPFCTIHLILGGKRFIYTKPLQTLEKELGALPDSKYIVDYSDSFGSDYKHTLEILPLLKNTGKSWFTEITIKNLLGISKHEEREELLTKMKKNGCAGVYIGIESISGPIGAKSLSLTQTEDAIKKIHDNGMLVLGSFMFDQRGDEEADIFKRTPEWVNKNNLDFVQYSLLALLPGCEMRRVALLKGKVIDNNPEHFDGAWPTIEHKMSPKERIEGLMYAGKETYSLANIARRVRHTPWGHKLIVAEANAGIHFNIAEWEKKATYEHWLATREEV